MTRELLQLKEGYEKAKDDYVSAYNNHETPANLKILKKTAGDAVKAFNDAMEAETYREWNKEGDAVRIAVRTFKFKKGVKITYKVNDATGVMTPTVNSTDIFVSLPMMQYVLGASVFNDPNWFSKVEKLAFLYAGYLAESLGMDSFDYPISELAKEFDFGADINVYSAEGVQKALQVVFDSILYIENPDVPGTNLITPRSLVVNGTKMVPAWEYITSCLKYHDRANQCLRLAHTGAFSSYVLEVMNMIMTNLDFRFVADDQFIIPNSQVEDQAEDEE